MNRAEALGLRVIVDLVVNHSSIDSPWFQSARDESEVVLSRLVRLGRPAPEEPQRGHRLSRDSRPRPGRSIAGRRSTTSIASTTISPTSTPGIRTSAPRSRKSWASGCSSASRASGWMRCRFSSRRKGAGVEHEQDFGLLKEMRDFLQWRSGDAILLAEANVPPDESMNYFGEEGEHLQMMLNFPVNQRLFYALATGDIDPLIWALEQTAKRPAQRAVGAVPPQPRRARPRAPHRRTAARKCSTPSGPTKRMQLYDRGIRRRLAPMLGNNRRQLELAFSLLFSLPGTPMMQYGDEIGIGDNLRLPERECARTPMQWTADRHGGFSRGAHRDSAGHRRPGLRIRAGQRRRSAARLRTRS